MKTQIFDETLFFFPSFGIWKTYWEKLFLIFIIQARTTLPVYLWNELELLLLVVPLATSTTISNNAQHILHSMKVRMQLICIFPSKNHFLRIDSDICFFFYLADKLSISGIIHFILRGKSIKHTNTWSWFQLGPGIQGGGQTIAVTGGIIFKPRATIWTKLISA